ncbi:MAG: TIGR00159 family protein [Aureispira sp.]|nr:TIGR00159 family protein [Aureispira sp.]
MIWLIQIGFLTITFWDLLDILIVGYLIFQIYKLLKGSLGFNIFIGLVLVYCVWWLVGALGMPLLSSILGQFISVGMIALLVLFQPEVRRFLLFVGEGSFQARFKFLDRLIKPTATSTDQVNPEKEKNIREVIRATEQMAKTKTGALMIFSNRSNLEGLYSSGVLLNSEISEQLILSIFAKDSPLHDGAVIFSGDKIRAASCVLPVSKRSNIPQSMGLRHRAAIGISENIKVLAFIVSEETGRIAYARNGEVVQNINPEQMQEILRKYLG